MDMSSEITAVIVCPLHSAIMRSFDFDPVGMVQFRRVAACNPDGGAVD